MLWDWCLSFIEGMSVDHFNEVLEKMENVLVRMQYLTKTIPTVYKSDKKGRELGKLLEAYDKALRKLKVVKDVEGYREKVEIDPARVHALLDCFEFVTTQLS